MSSSLHEFVDEIFEELGMPRVSPGSDEQPTMPVVMTAHLVEKARDQIGRYTLVEKLGAGGFGVVWRAEQTKPVRREVALKIIKLGMDTREVIARFEAERQALAVLDHPGIAKVFDAGATSSGRPYFVMELVRGLPLTQFCNEHALPLKERLELFVEACRAVQHAHQKGIIHRDLKPSNLLVAEVDGKPVPKVIDFGIAKATGEARLSENTLVTRMDLRMGTPAYMSPEQAEPGIDIDTRTDIYSLGVVLYELLTGQVPFPIGADGRVKRERDAQRPSTRIQSFTAEQLQKLGATQRVEGPKLIGLIKGDLDWIAMKALEEDRARRYDSANAFANDVLAFLRQQPVSAHPPTTWYLLKRFTQRNKLAVSAASVILLTLIVGIAISTAMYFNEKRALTRSEQVSKFLKKVLAQAGVYKSLGRDATMMREILDETAKTIGPELADQPDVQAELRSLIGQTYEDLNEYDLAHAQTTEALRLQRALQGGDHEGLANTLLDHASVLESLGKMKEAEAAAREALAMWQRLRGDHDANTGKAHALLAWTIAKAGRPAEAEASARIAMDIWRKHPDKGEISNAPRAMGVVLHRLKREEESVEVKREELEAFKKFHGPEHPNVQKCLDNLGYQLVVVKRYDEAEACLKESLRQGRKFYQDRDPVADHALAALANIASARQDWDAQLQYARESMAAAHRVFPPGHRYHRESSAVLARVLLDHVERFAESDPARAQSLLDELTTTKDFDPDVKTAGGWIDCLRGVVMKKDAAKLDEAAALIMRGLDALKKKDKPTAEDAKRVKKAEAWLARALRTGLTPE